VRLTDQPPELSERYTILGQIGAGGMGQVYLAHDIKHDRRVAIKVLKPELAELVGPQRFLREIRIASSLTHPNIVPVFDSGEAGGRLYYVMPYLEGASLRQRLDRDTMLSVPHTVALASDVAEGLAFLHAHGLVHRDIKPENLLLQGNHLLIADFGLARAVDVAAADAVTSEALVVGTPRYMSPEQASGGARIDCRSDIYSLGCVVYEMLAGEVPFTGATPQSVTAKKFAGQYQPLRTVRPTMPKAIDDTLARALAPLPADRFASVEEFSASLRSTTRLGRRSRRAWLLPLVVLAAGLWLALGRMPRAGSPAPSSRRIVVGMFENRSGDARYDPLGFMAADWITEGLQRTGVIEVVPTPTALAAARFVAGLPTTDPVRALARETGATLVVTGAIYQDRDSLVLQAQMATADGGRLVGVIEPIRTAETATGEALQQLRTRLMGLLALSLDERVLQEEHPPTYAAYRAFSEGMDDYIRNDYADALVLFRQSHAADTTFILPLLYASFCESNRGNYAAADTLLGKVASQRDRLSPHDRSWLEYQEAELAGRDAEALEAIRRAAELAPRSKAAYNFAVRALEARLPFQAESVLRRLPADVGPMRGWLPYWDVLTISLHAQGKHRAELKTAVEGRRRFHGRLAAYLPEARALAATRRHKDLEALWGRVGASSDTAAVATGSLAYEVGAELFAHGDSAAAATWFDRAYRVSSAGADKDAAEDLLWVRARAAARLGRFEEAASLADAVVRRDSSRSEYLGMVGILAAQRGRSAPAKAVLERLAEDTSPYTYGRPQFQAARVAAALGDIERANRLLARAQSEGLPFSLDVHSDPILARLGNSPALRALTARDP
jgi:tRNA A-37 threonylcarbamoyl transferase component Bud32/tetratricopeptide (TPR) repeat protein/TolB-like protein